MSPILPSGLMFNSNPELRSITGTIPLTESSQTLTYDYVAQDETGTETTQTFTITTVEPLTLPEIEDKLYFFGNSVTDPLPKATGGLGVITYTLEPAPPNPLSFSTATRMITGFAPKIKQTATYIYKANDDAIAEETTQTFTITISSTPIPIRLNVQPSPLNIVVGMNGQLTVGVSATEGVMLTVTVRDANIIEELAAEYLLMSGEASTQITVRGAVIGDTTLKITAAAEDYITETTLVSVVVLDTLRVEAEPTTFTLTEDESTQISVSLTRIEASEITVNIAAAEGLTVVPSSLEFTDTETRTVMVTATDADDYIGDRSRTLTLTADDYATATVTVNIIEDTPQPIGLSGVPTELSLVRFTSTIIEVSVEVAADLTVKAEGAVRLENGSTLISSDLGEMGSTRIEISGVSEGQGTVSFMVSGDRKATDTVVVSVTVTRPTLVVSASADELVIEARTTEALTVSVSAVGGHNSTLTATVSDEASGVAQVTPMEIANNVEADIPVTFTVTGLAAGNTTLTLTADRPFYESASTDVTVNVYFPPVRLNVPSSLQFEERATGLLTVAVIDSTQATITIRSDNDKIASVSSQAFTLMGGETNNSTDVVVNGVGIGMTTLTIEASADGYATGTATVMVDVLNRFRIVAPPTLDLAEGSTYAISVNLTRIEADRDVTVTVTIMNPPEEKGIGLTLSTSLLTFTELGLQTVTVISESDNKYTGDRSATLTFTASDYAMATVMIDIIEDTPQPVELMVVPTELNLVRFTSTEIAVSVGVDATLNVERRGAVILVGTQSEYSLTGGAEATQIQIRGEGFGEGTVTFTVSGFRKETDTVEVSVDVTKPTLVIREVSPSNIKLLTQETTIVTVSVSSIGGHSSTLTATVSDEAGGVVSVTPTKIRDVPVNMSEMFTVKGLNLADDVTIRLTARHPFYDSASTTVDVRVDLRPIGLSVEPSPLEVVTGTSEVLTIEVSATEGTTLTVTVGNDDRIEVLETEYLLMSGETSAKITVNGGEVGDTTLTIKAEAVGYAKETTSVNVMVLDLLRIKADPATFELAEDANTQISVSLNRIDADRDTVTVMIEPEGSGLTVNSPVLTFSRSSPGPKFITVETTTDNTYTGDRSRTLRLTADDYVTTRVMVTILENTPQQIVLEVEGSTELSLVNFTSTMIKVNVEVAADLTVKAEGAVRLAGDRTLVRTNLVAMGSTRIEISGVSDGEGTVSFTVSGDRRATDTVVVSVDVTRPTLVISEVSALAINLAARTTEALTVRVSAVGGHRSTLTAMVSDEASDVALVTPMEIANNVEADTTVIFTVRGLDAGDTTITLTASHPDYQSTSTEVAVRVYLPGVGLSATPTSLQLEQEATGLLTIAVSASTQAMIMISSDPSDIASVSSQAFTLMGGEINNSKDVVVMSGVDTGRTTLRITAIADGYAEETRFVNVMVIDRFRIVVPPPFDLAEGSTYAISVSLSRIEADRDVTVTVTTINPPEEKGIGLTLSTSLLTFTEIGLQTVTVTAESDNKYTGDRSAALIFTASDYATATVTVNIIEDTPQPIGLNVRSSTELSLVRFTSTIIEVSVDIAADLTVKAEGAVRLTGDGLQANYALPEKGREQIQIETFSVGEGTVTFIVSGVRKATDTVVVSVTVTEPTLVISASADELVIEARTTKELTVSVSAIGGHSSTLTATVTETGNVASVTPMKRPNVVVDTTVIFTVRGS